MRHILLIAALAAANSMGAGAQTTPTGIPAPVMQASVASANHAMLTAFEGQMMAAAKAMPAEKYDFSPASLALAGAKYEGVRTFASQVKHVAQANFFFYGAVSGMKPATDVNAIGDLKTKDEIVAALAASFVFAHQAVATLTTANEADPVDIDGIKTKGTLAGFAVAHGFDHYGQMVEYLRMNGVLPPGSK